MELVLSGLALAAVSDNNDISRIMKLVFDSYAQNQTYTNKLSVDTIQHHVGYLNQVLTLINQVFS